MVAMRCPWSSKTGVPINAVPRQLFCTLSSEPLATVTAGAGPSPRPVGDPLLSSPGSTGTIARSQLHSKGKSSEPPRQAAVMVQARSSGDSITAANQGLCFRREFLGLLARY